MKKILGLVLVAALGIFLSFTNAENDEETKIHFFKGTLAEAQELAKKEGKLIFMDAYAVWCGPCKMLSARVFTDPEVAKYYNENFINIKVDMEKGEGPNLAMRYRVNAYPTLLFLNEHGEVKFNHIGFIQASDLLKLGRQVNKKK